MTSRVRAECCTKCGGPLDFVGWDRTGQRVTTCNNSLGVKRNDGSHDSVLCNSSGEYTILGSRFKTVTWSGRRD